jgi:F-type H+-transporting ATPase subunit delta
MQIPKEARRKARELFDAALDASGRPDSSRTLVVADLLVKSAPRHAVQILKEFARLIRLATAKHHAVIESAVALDETTRTQILQSLQQRDGGEVTLEAKVDASLIGGARIRLGSEVWDGSVRSRLQNLTSSLS